MLIRQEGINGKLVEIRTTDFRGETYYYVEIREVAVDWPLHWEIRYDGTRPIIGTSRKTLEEANIVFDNYVKKAAAH